MTDTQNSSNRSACNFRYLFDFMFCLKKSNRNQSVSRFCCAYFVRVLSSCRIMKGSHKHNISRLILFCLSSNVRTVRANTINTVLYNMVNVTPSSSCLTFCGTAIWVLLWRCCVLIISLSLSHQHAPVTRSLSLSSVNSIANYIHTPWPTTKTLPDVSLFLSFLSLIMNTLTLLRRLRSSYWRTILSLLPLSLPP